MLHTALSLLLASSVPVSAGAVPSTETAKTVFSTTTLRELVAADRQVRGIHLTCWGAGSARNRKELIRKISDSVINTVVVAIKETDGKVYIPGVEKARAWNSHEAAISDPEAMLKDFKGAGLYTVARIVVFKDKILPRVRKDLAVKTPDGDLWRSRNGATWADPYSHEVWAYNLDIAERAAALGFDEIQFDYIRYPSEGNTSLCRYSKPNNRATATRNLKDFLDYARKRLAPYNVKISADVFGLTTTVKDDMGIGQDINALAAGADYVYPMMYPSHYAPGEYNLKNPNASPYKVINRGLKDAMVKMGPGYARLRPYLQDFSLGWHYGPTEVRAQLLATRLNLLDSWVLWNAANKYTWAALTPQSYRAFVDPYYK
ncbi:MAG TPA: hypothetical protein DCS63_02395 [Elusimicrobia bacterium]|nr:hypothetical protein [Elusimicrobiota bacterium]